ncbi:MAG TPA: TIGR00730 family Rossman fold protein [Alphaproteobacteria bacterium]|nr:TIGR00730 family Rossman fold protein [Alphaproteobacteria bacterium]
MTEIRSLCVYCGSSDLGPPSHRLAAAKLGEILAAKGVELVYGGGRVGLMGIIADAALSAGGRVTGIIPDHLIRAEVGHGHVSELIVVDSMHVRKETMFQRSDAFAILPGGPGTLDETFEILTWRQLRLHDKPVVVCNLEGYWNKLLDLIDMLIDAKYARPEFRDFYTVVDRVEDILPAIAAARAPAIPARVRKM